MSSALTLLCFSFKFFEYLALDVSSYSVILNTRKETIRTDEMDEEAYEKIFENITVHGAAARSSEYQRQNSF